MKPSSAFATVITTCMPTENESRFESGAWPESTTTISACWVPTPPGVSGRSVEAEPTTSTSSALRMSAWMPNARSMKNIVPTRHIQPSPCGNTTCTAKRRGWCRIVKPWRTRSRKSRATRIACRSSNSPSSTSAPTKSPVTRGWLTAAENSNAGRCGRSGMRGTTPS